MTDLYAQLKDGMQSQEWINNIFYDCGLVTVNGKQGVKETTVSDEKTEFTGASTYTAHTFRLPNDKAVTASFDNPKDKGKYRIYKCL